MGSSELEDDATGPATQSRQSSRVYEKKLTITHDAGLYNIKFIKFVALKGNKEHDWQHLVLLYGESRTWGSNNEINDSWMVD